MNFKLFLLFVMQISLIACGITPVVKPDLKPDPQPDLGSATSEVSGQVVEWQQKGRAGVSRAVISRLDPKAPSGFSYAVIAHGSIDARGKLVLKLADAPTPAFLQPFEVCGIQTTAKTVEANIDVAQRASSRTARNSLRFRDKSVTPLKSSVCTRIEPSKLMVPAPTVRSAQHCP